MKTEDLKKWHGTGRDFNRGVEILVELQGESFLTTMLKKHGDTAFNRKKLYAAIDVYLETINLDPEPAQVEEKPVEDGIDFFKLPSNLQELYFEKNQLYKEASYYKRSLKNFTGKPKDEPYGVTRIVFTGEQAVTRAKAIDCIAKNMKRNAAIWRELDYFQQHGAEQKKTNAIANILPEDLPDADIVLYRTRLQNWISQSRSRANKMEDGERKTALLAKISMKELEKMVVDARYNKWKTENQL